MPAVTPKMRFLYFLYSGFPILIFLGTTLVLQKKLKLVTIPSILFKKKLTVREGKMLDKFI
jgi:hypothetical protein